MGQPTSRTPRSIRSVLSRRAVSWEHLVILAHLDKAGASLLQGCLASLSMIYRTS